MTTALPVTATATVSPGTAFATAFAAHGDRTEVAYDYTITDAHKTRPAQAPPHRAWPAEAAPGGHRGRLLLV